MSYLKVSCGKPSHRLAALIAVVALLVMPVVASAAPASTDVASSWSFTWSGLVETVASWFQWTQPTVSHASAESDLGSTLDPDGRKVAPTDPANQVTLAAPTGELGSTLDPDG